jgi:EAL domain-containing protein (putative c-di-GMP-specific phosphodiesterase class I)
VLTRLRETGVHASIDDFGTGYSSLGYLRRLPVDQLKIDRSFVFNMTSDDQDEIIVQSTIDLAHNLGLTVVAEGAETLETLNRLRELGCDSVQGFVLSRPLPAEQVVAWLRQHRRAAAA